MRRHARRLFVIALLAGVAGALVLAPGCSKKPKPNTNVVTEQPPPKPVTPPPAPVEPPKVVENTEMNVVDVFFDYDKSILRDDARSSLEQDAKALQQSSDLIYVLEGHCDERGTVEYNLALGDRRAQSAKAFLTQYGIDASRLSTISYGKERPFATGHDEASWSQNRRVHFTKK
jgi:peptidoglycan-associated lipoprotein